MRLSEGRRVRIHVHPGVLAERPESEGWLVFHAMVATTKVLNEVGLGR